jgi:hypothetical protein
MSVSFKAVTREGRNSRNLSKFVRVKAANFRNFLSSLAASEDVLFAPEDLLITAIDFTLIASDVGFGFLETLTTPRARGYSKTR